MEKEEDRRLLQADTQQMELVNDIRYAFGHVTVM